MTTTTACSPSCHLWTSIGVRAQLQPKILAPNFFAPFSSQAPTKKNSVWAKKNKSKQISTSKPEISEPQPGPGALDRVLLWHQWQPTVVPTLATIGLVVGARGCHCRWRGGGGDARCRIGGRGRRTNGKRNARGSAEGKEPLIHRSRWRSQWRLKRVSTADTTSAERYKDADYFKDGWNTKLFLISSGPS